MPPDPTIDHLGTPAVTSGDLGIPAISTTEWKCVNCGMCCIRCFGTFGAEPADIARWRAEGRDDILEHFEIYQIEGVDGSFEFGQYVADRGGFSDCPFLEYHGDRCECLIHETKPLICQGFTCQEVDSKDWQRERRVKWVADYFRRKAQAKARAKARARTRARAKAKAKGRARPETMHAPS